jgi:hypothetical protein
MMEAASVCTPCRSTRRWISPDRLGSALKRRCLRQRRFPLPLAAQRAIDAACCAETSSETVRNCTSSASTAAISAARAVDRPMRLRASSSAASGIVSLKRAARKSAPLRTAPPGLPTEVGDAEIRPAEAGPAEIRLTEIGAVEVGSRTARPSAMSASFLGTRRLL